MPIVFDSREFVTLMPVPAYCPSNSSVRLTNAEAAATASAGRELEALGQFELADVIGVELAGPDVKILTGKQQTAKTVLAVAFGVNQGPQAAEHGLVAEEDDVGRVSLAGGLDVHRAFEPVAGLGQQLADPRRCVLVLDQVRTVQALLKGVDNRHGRLVSRLTRNLAAG